MSFLPGLQDAVSKAYTTLDDIVELASKGHDVVHLLQSLTLAVAEIFHHTKVRPEKVSLLPYTDQLSVFETPSQSLLPAEVAVTRDEKISRDLRP